MERKYKYTLNGTIYFIVLAEKDKELFERKYGISLIPWD
jgi:hypothetical protein